MNTLYIIGNGFDLAHGLPTRYGDFHDWLQHSGFSLAKQFVDSIHGLTKDVDLWKSFEEALGSINLEEYISFLKDEYIDIQDSENWIAQSDSFYAGIEFEVKKQYKNLITAFGEWARSINADYCEQEDRYKSLNNPNNYFFTFNYTDTLEKIYGINKDRIMHIHGDARDNDDSIIVGHNHDYRTERENVLSMLEQILPADSGESGDKLLGLLNISIKETRNIISNYGSYFRNLETLGIAKIIVLGHSYGHVDMPYFERIKEACPIARWELNCFSENDKEAANAMITKLYLSAIIV